MQNLFNLIIVFMEVNMFRVRYIIMILCLFLAVNVHSQAIKASTYGFEKDPSLALLKAMHSRYDTIIIDYQSKAWNLKPMKFQDIKNKVVVLEKGVELRALPGAFKKANSVLLKFIRCSNIKILGNDNLLIMNKEEYLDGEWRHGISLRACKDFYIENLTINGSGGDGIYIAGWGKGTYSENIRIENIQSLNNKRQGMSIISAKNVKIVHSVFAQTKGTLPGAGLDLEPNNADDVLSQIEIIDCIFRDNDHAGIKLALGQLRSTSTPVSIYFKNCILRNNHSPTHPKSAAEILLGANKDSPVGGEVVFENCLIENSKWGLVYSRKRADAYTVTFIDCVAKNICKDSSWPPFYFEVPDYREKTGALGGYTFKNLYLEYKADLPFMIVRGSRLGTLESLKNIHGDVTILGTKSEDFKYINYDPERNQNVELRLTHKLH